MLTDVILVKAGAEYKKGPLLIQGGLGKEQVLLRPPPRRPPPQAGLRPSRMVKKTIELETR